MKALLIRRGVILRRIHDLVEFHRLLPTADGAHFAVEDLEALNPWTIEGRYPADVGNATAAEIAEALDTARRVVEAVGHCLAEPT